MCYHNIISIPSFGLILHALVDFVMQEYNEITDTFRIKSYIQKNDTNQQGAL
ncbi:hypothetical protein MTTB_p100 (plasmid) [Methanothermobacter tenebrarum]|uniref:DUF3307 domain-containing protein n=1 Tax=Methanothermobacter tenebrarum TaxID=680118 RepID=A0ABM7YDW3_9EURY|nr:hypothetical protein MTTB_p100 [Methanothermobacter tenebrarum]